MSVAVITLTRGRTAHLVELVRGLSRGRPPPDELAVAVMGGQDLGSAVPDTCFPIKWVRLEVTGDDPLPMAAARNRAAAATRSERLVFLDVDCIPGPDLVASYDDGLAELDGLLMGDVRYLPPGWPRDPAWTWLDLVSVSQPHPIRPDPPELGLRHEGRYGLFWSLTFAVNASTFDGLRGFDTTFAGYGGEDTDLAFTARREGVPLAWVAGALCLHQHHDTYDPPLNHVAEIVVNANRFHDKWGTWPMGDWLERFAEIGLVDWSPQDDHLELLREPTGDELASARQPTAVPSA